MKSTKFLLFATVIVLVSGVLAGSASADYKTKISLVVGSSSGSAYDEAYIITVPGDIKVSASGWNSLGVISVKHDATSRDNFDPAKKLVVAVTTSNDFELKSGTTTDTISYSFSTSENGSAVSTLEFTAASIDEGTSIDVGIKVSDYSNVAAGTYEDYITFKAEVQDVSADSTIQQYYDKLTEATYDGQNWNFMTVTGGAMGGEYSLNGQTITAEQATALAQYQATKTGKSCIVVYSVSSEGTIYYAENDGNTDYDDAYGLTGLQNTTIYYVAN